MLVPCRELENLRGEATAFKIRVRMDAGGHNNIKINPVFRGMP
jgi:hypothetical protein